MSRVDSMMTCHLLWGGSQSLNDRNRVNTQLFWEKQHLQLPKTKVQRKECENKETKSLWLSVLSELLSAYSYDKKPNIKNLEFILFKILLFEID